MIQDISDVTPDMVRTWLGKSQKWRDDRKGKVSASVVAYILGQIKDQQKAKRIINQTQPPEEIAEVEENPRVMMGAFSECLNKVLLENELNIKVKNIKPFTHPDNPIHTASPDGVVAKEFCDVPTIIECKHTNGFNNIDKVHATYYPQIQWQLYVTGYQRVILSVIYGNDFKLPDSVTFVERNEEYIAQMASKINAWYEKHIINDEPIVDDVVAPKFIPLDERKDYDFSTNNEWVNHSVNFVLSKEQYDLHNHSKKEIKKLIPDDAKTVVGGGVEAKVGKTGRVDMTEKKNGQK